MRALIQDLLYSARLLRRSPGFATAAVLTLGLGIGTTTTFFALVDALLHRPAPGVRLDGAHAVQLWAQGQKSDLPVSLAGTRSLEAAPPAGVSAVSGVVGSTVTAMARGRLEQLTVEGVTGGHSAVFDLTPQVGRWIGVDDDGPGSSRRVAVISDRLWREWYRSDPSVTGTTLRVKGTGTTTAAVAEAFTIVGVGPPGFRGPRPGILNATDLWVPMGALVDADPFARIIVERVGVGVLVRTRPDIDVAAVAPQILAAMASPDGAGAAATGTPVATRATLRPAERVFGAQPAQLERSALMVVALSILVLLAACANLANMLYARGIQRAGEMAVRLTLGARRVRLMRLVGAEALLIAISAACVGFGLAVAGAGLFTRALPGLDAGAIRLSIPAATPNGRVFLFSLGAGVLAALVVGGLTAWRSTRVPPAGVLASSGLASGLTAAGRGVRTTMVAIQVTAAVVLVMACGFYLETMVSQLVDRGVIGRRIQYDSDRVVTARVDLRQHDFTEARGRSFFDQGLRRAAAIGGVEAIALGSGLPGAAGPLRPGEMYLMLEAPPEGLAGDARRGVADFAVVSPGYLKAIGLPLRRGREFVETDADGATLVGVVSEGAAATLWPGQDAIGKRFRFNADFLTVVGVSANPVGASERWRFDLRTPNFVFVPFAQHYRPSMALVARSAAPAALIEALRATVAAVDPEVAVIDAATAEDSALAWWAPARAALMLIGGLAAAALGIAMLGVYGVLQFFVSSRTREFGIRTALGASSGRVIKLVLDEAVHIVLVGLLVGVLVAALGSRVIEFRQFGVMPNSITNWVVVPLLILGSGLLAGYLPARRAARVDPTVALRSL